MIRNVLQFGVFVVMCFLALEVSYRVYAHGLVALNPLAMNSMSTIIDSGLVRASEYPDVWFELQPDLDVWHMGARLRTNSRGLADREYPLAKPAGVFRIAVVGSSWSMASGVDQDDTWHAVLERRLNATGGAGRVEVINFAVEQYGISEILGTLRHKVPQYQPDLVIVSMTVTTSLFAPPGDQPFVPPPRLNTLFDSYILRLAGLSTGSPGKSAALRPMIERDIDKWGQNVVAGLRDMHAAAAASGADFALAWMGTVPLIRNYAKWVGEVSDELGFPVLRAYEPLVSKYEANWGESFLKPEYKVSRVDEHPNPEAHSLMADIIEVGLREAGLLP